MAEEKQKFVYFKRNVDHSVALRYHMADSQGVVLNNVQPWVAIPENMLRDFKMANRQMIINGLIIQTDIEPDVNWDTPNALNEEDMDGLLKNYAKLKSSLEAIDSGAIVNKLLERAKEQNKSVKMIGLIQSRLDELSDLELIGREDMRGVS